MDDNATCHRTLAVQDCLDSEGIQRLVWPARSQDLNPTENVWDALGRQVAGRNYPPTNKNTLIRSLTEEWDKLPQQLLDNVVQMGDRLTNRSVNEHFHERFLCSDITNTYLDNEQFEERFFVFGQRTHMLGGDQGDTLEIMDENLTTARDLEMERNVSPSEQEEDERGPMPTSAIKDLLKKWEAVRAMVLEWHSNQADIGRVGDLYNDNAINYFRKILKKREKQSTLDMFFNAP
ncbi:uncharacterized protein TNCV_3587021 [Trichonephila clavipes]|nr:uncharacterized protein TNCV_3587021 [Trichonephila clavipes]